jgi:hypothetical protein
MSIEPLVRDDNKHPLYGHGSGTITYRWASVDSDGQDISFPVDVKSCFVHIEGATTLFTVTGSLDDSEAINITVDGTTIKDIDIAVAADETIVTVAAPTGQTINVSAMGWR